MPKSESFGKITSCFFVNIVIEIESACGLCFEKECKVMAAVNAE